MGRLVYGSRPKVLDKLGPSLPACGRHWHTFLLSQSLLHPTKQLHQRRVLKAIFDHYWQFFVFSSDRILLRSLHILLVWCFIDCDVLPVLEMAKKESQESSTAHVCSRVIIRDHNDPSKRRHQE